MSSDIPIFKLDADGAHVHVSHRCTRPLGWPPVEATLPIGDDGWTTVTAEPLTVTPSIHCTECGLHGYITAGVWQPC